MKLNVGFVQVRKHMQQMSIQVETVICVELLLSWSCNRSSRGVDKSILAKVRNGWSKLMDFLPF